MSEDLLVIFVFSLCGAFWCLAGADTKTHRDALKLLARITCVVTGLGYFGGHLMQKYIGLMYPWNIATASFVIAATAEYHPTLLESFVKRIKKVWK